MPDFQHHTGREKASQEPELLMWRLPLRDHSPLSGCRGGRAGWTFQVPLPGAGRVDAPKEGGDFRQGGGAVTGRARPADREETDACLSELLNFLPLPALVLGGGLEVSPHVGHGLTALRAEGRFPRAGETVCEGLAAVETGVVLQAPGDLVVLAAVNESGTGFAGHVLRVAAGLDAGIHIVTHIQIY